MRSSNIMKGLGLHIRYSKIPIYIPGCTSFTTISIQEVVVGNKFPLNQPRSTSSATCDPGGEFEQMHNNWPNQLCWSSINHADHVHVSSLHAGLPTRATENNWLDLGLNYQYFKTAYIKTYLALTVLLNLIIVRIVLMQKYTAPNSVLTAPSPLHLYFGLGFPHACVFPIKGLLFNFTRGHRGGNKIEIQSDPCLVISKSSWRISYQENRGFSICAHPSNWSALLYSRPPSLMDSFTGSYVFLILAVKWHYWPHGLSSRSYLCFLSL